MPAISCNILDFIIDGIGRHGFILQAAPDHDSPEKGFISYRNKALRIVGIINVYMFISQL